MIKGKTFYEVLGINADGFRIEINLGKISILENAIFLRPV